MMKGSIHLMEPNGRGLAGLGGRVEGGAFLEEAGYWSDVSLKVWPHTL